MAEMTREELAVMTDQELLAYEREHHDDPFMTLAKAKGMQRLAQQSWHVGAARTKADREARAEARRRLHQMLFRQSPLLSLSPTAQCTCHAGSVIPLLVMDFDMNSPGRADRRREHKPTRWQRRRHGLKPTR